MTERIAFLVPLPPPALRSNARVHWKKKMAARQAYSEAVYDAWLFHAECVGPVPNIDVPPWQRAKVAYEWRYCGTEPDVANVPANVKTLQDVLCCAPNTGQISANNMTYLGLVENDKNIEPSWSLRRVAHKSEQGVFVEVTKL